MRTPINNMVINLFFCCCLTACLKANTSPGQQSSDDSNIQVNTVDYNGLDQKIQLLMSEKNIPGMSIVMVHDQDIRFLKSYGVSNLSENTPMKTQSSVRLASATKVLTGLLVMSLAEEGVIDLNKPFEAYFPEAPGSWHGIPLWRILNHTSGLPRFLNSKEFEGLSDANKAIYSHREAFEYLRGMPMEYQPGTDWRYQQSAYSMLAMMLIELTGKSWDELLFEHVFEPADMTATQYGDSLGEHPITYVLKDDELIASEYHYPRAFSMGGGYNTTVSDLINLFKALNTNQIVSSKFLVRESTLNERLHDLKSEFYAPATIVKQFGQAQSLGHSGGGGLADIRYFPEQKVGIAVLSNYSGSGVAIDLTEHVSSLLFGEKVSR